MTQEDKELLLKDLCARLPYGVMADTPKGKGHVCDINYTIFYTQIGVNVNPIIRTDFSIEGVKPYLFPLSSMTKKQKQEYHNNCNIGLNRWGDEIYYDCVESIDWLNTHHFDYRGLIEKGLAIDATGLNIY